MQNLDPSLWRLARSAALERDNHRCQAADKFGVLEIPCRETVGVHVHHLDPAGEPYELANLLTLCAVHHARLHHRDPKLRERRPRRARANAAAYRKYEAA